MTQLTTKELTKWQAALQSGMAAVNAEIPAVEAEMAETADERAAMEAERERLAALAHAALAGVDLPALKAAAHARVLAQTEEQAAAVMVEELDRRLAALAQKVDALCQRRGQLLRAVLEIGLRQYNEAELLPALHAAAAALQENKRRAHEIYDLTGGTSQQIIGNLQELIQNSLEGFAKRNEYTPDPSLLTEKTR